MQTTKDLTQIWNGIPDHSSATTLLLDDSPRKAHLQPWNHLCVPDYGPEMRAHDVDVWQRTDGSSAPQSSNLTPNEGGVDRYDETLLAIVGILEELRRESDVASWIKSGGLRGPGVVQSVSDEPAMNDRSTPAEGALWFESDEVLGFWAGKGRQILSLLNITITADVNVPPSTA